MLLDVLIQHSTSPNVVQTEQCSIPTDLQLHNRQALKKKKGCERKASTVLRLSTTPALFVVGTLSTFPLIVRFANASDIDDVPNGDAIVGGMTGMGGGA
jgi:hypothetical protein